MRNSTFRRFFPFTSDRSLFLKLGGEEVEYDPGFQLYIQTKLSNPHYKPEIAAQVGHLRENDQAVALIPF